MFRVLTALVAVFLCLLPIRAWGQPQCFSHGQIKSQLEEKYKEHVSAVGLDGRGNLIEVYINDETRTWTIVWTQPQGPSCVLTSGRDWSAIPRSEKSNFPSTRWKIL